MNQNLEKLEKFEKNERLLATRLFDHIPTIKSYEFTSGKIAYDTSIELQNGMKILGEIKVRNFDVDAYPTYILQVDKLVSLIKRAKTNGYDLIYYLNFFNNPNPTLRSFIVFNLSKRIEIWKVEKPKVEIRYMNAATFASTTYKIPKEVIMLSYDPNMDWKGAFVLN